MAEFLQRGKGGPGSLADWLKRCNNHTQHRQLHDVCALMQAYKNKVLLWDGLIICVASFSQDGTQLICGGHICSRKSFLVIISGHDFTYPL